MVAASHRFRVDLIKDGGKARAKLVSFGMIQIRRVRSNFDDEVERKTSRKTSKIQKNRKKMKNVYVKIT